MKRIKIKNQNLFLLLIFIFTGCTHVQTYEEVHTVSTLTNVDPLKKELPNENPKNSNQNVQAGRELEEIFLNIEKKIDEEEKNEKSVSSAPLKKEEVTSNDFSMPVEMNAQVKNWIYYFSIKDRDRFKRFLESGKKYQDVVAATLGKHGLPSDLYYLAMIESGYQSHAVSHASAVGVWQFIRGTAERYGLKVNAYVDERRDPIRATDAAARYLRDLHNAFQSWYLAMASYNAGENRILSSIFKGKSRNFWDLSEKKLLPLETREYVPKFLAAVVIGRHPEKFGFNDLQKPDYPTVKAIEIPERIRLKDLALLADLSVEELKKVNPHLIQEMTPPGSKTYEVWVPAQNYSDVKKILPRLAKLQLQSVTEKRILASQKVPESKKSKIKKYTYQPVKKTIKNKHYQVKNGDSLISISKQYNVRLDSLKMKNNLKKDSIYAGQKLIIPIQ